MSVKKPVLPLLLLLFSALVYSQEEQSVGYYIKGMQKMNQEDYSAAVSFFNKAIACDSLNGLYYGNRGFCYFRSNAFEKAKSDFLKCLQLGDENPRYYYFAGLCNEKLENFDQAVELYDQAILVDSAKHAYYYHRGIARMKNGDFHLATRDFSSSIELHPLHVPSYFHRSQSNLMLQKDAAACMDMAVVQKLDTSRKVPQYTDLCEGNELSKWYDTTAVSRQVQIDAPRFSHKGVDDFNEYIAKNINVPKAHSGRPLSGGAISRFVVSSDGRIDSIRVIQSKSESISQVLHEAIEETKNKWQGGEVNGIPADFEFTSPVTLFSGPTLNEIQSWKKALKKAVGKNDTIRSIKICTEILDINPLAEDILDIRASLYEIKGDTSAAKRDRRKLRDMKGVRFRYDMDELREKRRRQITSNE